MSDLFSIVLQTDFAESGLVNHINSILAAEGSKPLMQINGDQQVGAKSLAVNVYVLTINRNAALVNQIEEAVRNSGDDVAEQEGQVVLLVSREDTYTRVTRPGDTALLR